MEELPVHLPDPHQIVKEIVMVRQQFEMLMPRIRGGSLVEMFEKSYGRIRGQSKVTDLLGW